MGRIFTRILAVFLLFGFLIIMAAMFTGCKSVNKAKEKKKESVSLVQKNDVQLEQEIQTDLEIIQVDKSKKLSFESLDPEKPSEVIHGRDTIKFKNAKVKVDLKDQSLSTVDRSSETRKEKDQSELDLQAENEQKNLDLEKKGTSPVLIWSLLILVLIILAVWYLDKRFRFVSKIMSHFKS